jgi:hypothetical protein
MLREIAPGLTFQSQSAYGEEMIFSGQEFAKGVHGLKIRFDDVSETYRCHFLVGLYDLQRKKDEFKPYICVMCTEHFGK